LPLYEYECPQDGTFERMQKFSDPLLKACPKCGGPVEKLPSAPAIQFKGTGWYVTDYARKSGTDSEAKKEGASSSESKGADSGAKSTGSAGGSTSPASGTSGASSSEKK
jgi:putative FmdB family regulatory protein